MSGYIAQFHARVDDGEAAFRFARQQLEYAWAPSASLGLTATTMGSLGSYGYSAPPNLCFDIWLECQALSANVISPMRLNNPINDDAHRGAPDAINDSVDANVAQVLAIVAQMRPWYPVDADGVTRHLPWTMGDDFAYGAASYNFLSLDKLIHYVNLNTSLHGVNLLYSTQAMYAQARIDMSPRLTLKVSDSMPYSVGGFTVWSGYFTSRSALKAFVRETSTLFTAARQLQAWAAPPADMGWSNPLWLLEQALGVAQHHDAVSGTSKQVVAFDYARRLQQGRDAASAAITEWLSALLGVGGAAPAPPAGWVGCDLANATLCALTEAAASGDVIALVLYNAQSQLRAGTPVRIPVHTSPGEGIASWAVVASDGATPVLAQLVPASPADAGLREYYGAPASANASWLCFLAPPAPAAGFTTVFLQPVATPALAAHTFASTVEEGVRGSAATLSNGVVTLSFSDAGLLAGFASSAPGGLPSVPLTQSLLYYSSSSGDLHSLQASGAYAFRPNASQTAYPVAAGAVVALTVVRGPIVSEAWQVFGPWATQTVRLWANASSSFETAWTVGPVPTEQLVGQGKEVVSRFSIPGWATGGTFGTDSNGREWQPRVRNARPDYNLTLTEPVALNYFPVNTAIRVTDAVSGGVLTVLTDRSQGGSSLRDGEVELMVHRALTQDDGEGVFEALNEPGVTGPGIVVRGTHTVILAPGGAPAVRAHRGALQDALLPLVWRGGALPRGTSPAAWAAALPHGASASLLSAPLPRNVLLLTLHAWSATSALVRLAHTYEAGEDAELAANATVALATLFAPAAMRIVAAVEMTLTGGQPLRDVKPVTYHISGVSDGKAPCSGSGCGGTSPTVDVTLPIVPPPPAGPLLEVMLAPMQIRTFNVTFAPL